MLTNLCGAPTADDDYPLRIDLNLLIPNHFGGARFKWAEELPGALEGEGIRDHQLRACWQERRASPCPGRRREG